jgi:hypothetical protein
MSNISFSIYLRTGADVSISLMCCNSNDYFIWTRGIPLLLQQINIMKPGQTRLNISALHIQVEHQNVQTEWTNIKNIDTKSFKLVYENMRQ